MPPKTSDANYDGTIELKNTKEYDWWIRREKLPATFIRYEQISSLGNFEAFSVTRTYGGNIYSYRYMLRDEIGERICISFESTRMNYGSKELYTLNDVSNINWMISLKEDAKGKAFNQQVHWNGITYHYFMGQLGVIGFMCADWHCLLWRTYDPKDIEKIKAMLPQNGQEATEEEGAKYNLAAMPTYLYPKDRETPLARFLDINTAEAELQRLLVEIEQNRHEAVPWMEITISALGGAVIAALATYFIMRKKVKNATRLGANGENLALADGVPTDNSPAYTPSAGDSDGDGKTNAPADAPAAGDPPSAS
jgi:hypothetical protein